MTENAEKIVQLSFRVTESQRNAFNAAVKGRGMDAADVLLPVVEQTIAEAKGNPEGIRQPDRGPVLPIGDHRWPRDVQADAVELVEEFIAVLKRPDLDKHLRALIIEHLRDKE